MKRFLFSLPVFCSILLFTVNTFAQTAGDEDKDMFNKAQARDQKVIDKAVNGWWKTSMVTHDQRIQWWRDAKFGMFVHWGVYALAGGEWEGKHVEGYSEHLMRKEKVSKAAYLKLAKDFNPELFNASQWISAAKNAGMNYFIITAKHHDGFAMYPSAVSDFNIAKQTPFQRDPLAELAAAAKKQGVKFGFYYSHAFDWEDPNAPGNDWEYQNPGGDKQIGGSNWYDQHPGWLPKAIRYLDEKAIPQILELIKRYHPDILWFDTPHKLPFSENLRILEAIRRADPNVVVNGRLARNGNMNFGDYINTGDRPAEFAPVSGAWEAIPTTNESYGYSKNDHSHKSVSFFVQLLAKAVSRGGNLLLNIGPKGDGTFDTKDKEILNGISVWTKKNGESIYQAGKTPLPLQSWGVTTSGKDKIYLHVFNWPSNGRLSLGGLLNQTGSPYFLSDPSKKAIAIKHEGSEIVFNLPGKMPDSLNTVIVLPVKGKLEIDSTRLLASGGLTTRLLAFDADYKDPNLKFGDGKTDKYYITGWKSSAQKIGWKFSTTKSNTYKILIKYIAMGDIGGQYTLKIENNLFTKNTSSSNDPVTEEIGVVKLDSGLHNLILTPVEIPKSELMKLLEVQLIPIN
jgi:alpha-L-fucosidase